MLNLENTKQNELDFEVLLTNEYFVRLLQFCVFHRENERIEILLTLIPSKDNKIEEKVHNEWWVSRPYQISDILINHNNLISSKEKLHFNKLENCLSEKKECLNLLNQVVLRNHDFGEQRSVEGEVYDNVNAVQYDPSFFMRKILNIFNTVNCEEVFETFDVRLEQIQIKKEIKVSPHNFNLPSKPPFKV